MSGKRFDAIMRDIGARTVEPIEPDEADELADTGAEVGADGVSESADGRYIRVRISEGVNLLVPRTEAESLGLRTEAESLARFNRIMRDVGGRPV
jgi:hypothetical protein